MGYPSENVESIYRNALDDVRRLLEEKHKVVFGQNMIKIHKSVAKKNISDIFWKYKTNTSTMASDICGIIPNYFNRGLYILLSHHCIDSLGLYTLFVFQLRNNPVF